MKKRMLAGLLSIALCSWMVSACGPGGDTNNNNTNNNNTASGDCTTAPTYAKCIQPIFAASCVPCHGEGSASGGLTLVKKSSADLQKDSIKGSGLKVLTPEKPDESTLYQKLLDKDKRATAYAEIGGKMPIGGKTITAEQIAQIKKWIELGAKDD